MYYINIFSDPVRYHITSQLSREQKARICMPRKGKRGLLGRIREREKRKRGKKGGGLRVRGLRSADKSGNDEELERRFQMSRDSKREKRVQVRLQRKVVMKR